MPDGRNEKKKFAARWMKRKKKLMPDGRKGNKK